MSENNRYQMPDGTIFRVDPNDQRLALRMLGLKETDSLPNDVLMAYRRYMTYVNAVGVTKVSVETLGLIVMSVGAKPKDPDPLQWFVDGVRNRTIRSGSELHVAGKKGDLVKGLVKAVDEERRTVVLEVAGQDATYAWKDTALI